MLALDMKVESKCVKFGEHQSKSTEQKGKSVFLAKHENSIFLICILILFLKIFIFIWKYVKDYNIAITFLTILYRDLKISKLHWAEQ